MYALRKISQWNYDTTWGVEPQGCYYTCNFWGMFLVPCTVEPRSAIKPPRQVFLATVMRWLEYNVNSVKQFAALCHKIALLQSIQLQVRYYKCWQRSQNRSYPSARYTCTRFLTRAPCTCIGSCQLPHIHVHFMRRGDGTPRGEDGRVWIGGDSFQGSPPSFSNGYGCGCRTLSHLKLQW